jgi:hypothetical protein
VSRNAANDPVFFSALAAISGGRVASSRGGVLIRDSATPSLVRLASAGTCRRTTRNARRTPLEASVWSPTLADERGGVHHRRRVRWSRAQTHWIAFAVRRLLARLVERMGLALFLAWETRLEPRDRHPPAKLKLLSRRGYSTGVLVDSASSPHSQAPSCCARTFPAKSDETATKDR